MAECALAVSFATVGGGMQIDYVDGDLLSDTGEARAAARKARRPAARVSSNCGPPLPGFEVEVRDEDGQRAARAAGGPRLPAQPQRDERLLQRAGDHAEVLSADGWLNTGDLGYRVDGVAVSSPAAPRIC